MAIAGALHPMSSGPKPPVQIILTSGTSWTVPSDWNSANNKIECIGAGANSVGGSGGGGGAYAAKNNLPLTPGAVISYQVGAQSSVKATTLTWFVNSTTVLADGSNFRSGGSASNCVGDVKYDGGSADNVAASGGGGAAGPNGAGGSSTGESSNGGVGDAGFGGSGAIYNGAPAGNGTEWGAAGSGGGGAYKGAAGKYGGGGALGGGPGQPGVIVITYTPA